MSGAIFDKLCFMTYREEAESLRKQLDAAHARIADLEAKLSLAEAHLCDVAEIAHKGGLMNMTESDALIAIRRATLKHFNASVNPHPTTEALHAWLKAKVEPVRQAQNFNGSWVDVCEERYRLLILPAITTRTLYRIPLLEAEQPFSQPTKE